MLGGDREVRQSVKGSARVRGSSGPQSMSTLETNGGNTEPGFQAIDQPSSSGAVTTGLTHASESGKSTTRTDFYNKSGQNASAQRQR